MTCLKSIGSKYVAIVGKPAPLPRRFSIHHAHRLMARAIKAYDTSRSPSFRSELRCMDMKHRRGSDLDTSSMTVVMSRSPAFSGICCNSPFAIISSGKKVREMLGSRIHVLMNDDEGARIPTLSQAFLKMRSRILLESRISWGWSWKVRISSSTRKAPVGIVRIHHSSYSSAEVSNRRERLREGPSGINSLSGGCRFGGPFCGYVSLICVYFLD